MAATNLERGQSWLAPGQAVSASGTMKKSRGESSHCFLWFCQNGGTTQFVLLTRMTAPTSLNYQTDSMNTSAFIDLVGLFDEFHTYTLSLASVEMPRNLETPALREQIRGWRGWNATFSTSGRHRAVFFRIPGRLRFLLFFPAHQAVLMACRF